LDTVFNAVIDFLANGITRATVWHTVLYTLIVTHITIAAVTIYLHRHQAHRALDLHALPSHFFRFWLWLTTGSMAMARRKTGSNAICTHDLAGRA
jgi:stearoyl-CoA desaturase (delta-9 desaturase)